MCPPLVLQVCIWWRCLFHQWFQVSVELMAAAARDWGGWQLENFPYDSPAPCTTSSDRYNDPILRKGVDSLERFLRSVADLVSPPHARVHAHLQRSTVTANWLSACCLLQGSTPHGCQRPQTAWEPQPQLSVTFLSVVVCSLILEILRE